MAKKIIKSDEAGNNPVPNEVVFFHGMGIYLKPDTANALLRSFAHHGSIAQFPDICLRMGGSLATTQGFVHFFGFALPCGVPIREVQAGRCAQQPNPRIPR